MQGTSLKAKILTAFLTVIAVLFISEAFIFVMHFAVVKKYQKITDNMVSEYRIIETTSNLVGSFYDLIQYANNKQRIDTYNNNLGILQTLLAKLDKNITDSGSWTVYLGAKSTVNSVIEESNRGVAAILAGNFSEVTANYADANQKNNFVRENTANLLLQELAYTEKLQADIVKTQLWSEIIGLILFAGILIGCLWYSLSFSKKLINPLVKLTKLAKVIGNGNLEANVENVLLKGDDEVASLANSFNSMVLSLKDNIKKLKEYNAQLIKTKKIVVSKEMKISELNEINKMKDEFMNIVTHELKTPLIPIIGLSEVMEQQKESLPPEYQKYVVTIHKEGVRLNELIRQMLQATRSENGEEPLVKEKFILNDLILSLETSLTMLTQRTDSKIVFNFKDPGIEMESDKEKISQVIYNFVDNAVKYGPNGQTVVVFASKQGEDKVLIEVADEGTGIPEKLKEKLFLKFSQLEPSLSRSREGMGLGLYICKRNVEMLGGEIGTKNKTDGQGAVFYFSIPLVAKEENAVKKKKNGLINFFMSF
jgi:signal transduction histidine kinase